MARTVRGDLPVAFRYTPGIANGAFLEALRDRGAFRASRCEPCGVVYLPARLFCERCFAEVRPDTECGPGGTVTSFTVGHVGIDGEPLNAPATVVLVRLDGADTVLMHRWVGGDRPAIGMRARPVLRGDRTGSILDVEGFVAEGG